MIIEVGTDAYKKLVEGRDFTRSFESKLPSYSVLQAALVDPSLTSSAIDQVLELTSSTGVLHSAALADLQLGSQMLTFMRLTASRLGEDLTLPGNGMLTSMTQSIVLTMQNFKVPSKINSEQVEAILVDAAFAAGLKGLGAIGPIGKIAAAIIGAAKGIYDLVQSRKEHEEMEKDRREKLVYLSMPPLQQPDTEVDSFYVESVLRPLMESGGWTPIFSPRFESDQWVGAERNGGYAFAPGTKTAGVDALGRDNTVFESGGGVGLIPGLDRVTSVVQVSLDPLELKDWKGTGVWPLRPQHVTDVGKFYVNTGRLGAIAWGWATAYDASPDLYKIDVGVHKGPGSKHLHYRWKRYCDGGIRYMQETSDDWVNNLGKGRALSGNPEFVLGTGIGCAVGAWRCSEEQGIYKRLNPGRFGDRISGIALGKGTLGCVMDPPSMQIRDQHGDRCVRTLYEVYIRRVLEKVRARQHYFLWHSLVAAYVRQDFDAFRDPKMKDELMRARKVLLEHPDRKLIELRDVAGDEPGLPGSGMTWKDQLIASGVRRTRPWLHGSQRLAGAQPGTLKPTDKPAPKVPVSKYPMPFGELAERPDEGASSSRSLLWLAGGVAVLGAGGLAYYLKKRDRHG